MTTTSTTYDGLGFGPILLQGGISETETAWGPATGYERIGELHREIALAVSSSAFPICRKVLRFLRQTLDLTQVQLGEILGYTDGQMVAQWERGTREIPQTISQQLRLKVRGKLDPQVSISLALEEIWRPVATLEFAFHNGAWTTINTASGGWSRLSRLETKETVQVGLPSNRMDTSDSYKPLAA